MSIDISIYDEEVAPEELENMGSFNHSYVQSKLGHQFWKTDKYVVLTEISLDTAALQDPQLRDWFKGEMKPDIALYSQRTLNFHDDILRMTEMPILAVEILSPMQATLTLLRKVRAYFELGVQSCWIVAPLMQTVTVYTSPDASITYSREQTVVDAVVGVEIPLSTIFL